MRAVLMRDFGAPDVLQVEDVAEPEVAADEVLVRVEAVTVNRSLDLLIRAGRGRRVALPHILGVDPAGVVAAVGSSVTRVHPGQRVAVTTTAQCGTCAFCTGGRPDDCANARQIGVHRPGGYAELVAVPDSTVVPIPDSLGFAEAAVLLRHVPTAFNLLRSKGGLRPGEVVLVMGAGGGLGSAGVQVAKLLGATVIAGAGSAGRVASAVKLGADHGVDYRTTDLAEEVARITDGQGVDMVFENVGDPVQWPKAYGSLRHGGRLMTAGGHAGGVVSLNVHLLYQRRLKIIGGASYTGQDVTDALAAASNGRVLAHIDRRFPLREAARAHRLADSGDVDGKLILEPQVW